MDNLNKRNPQNWTPEEKDRVVGVFQLLLEMDKKQHPERYRKPPTHEKGQNDILEK
jgi:hypothetical protein